MIRRIPEPSGSLLGLWAAWFAGATWAQAQGDGPPPQPLPHPELPAPPLPPEHTPLWLWIVGGGIAGILLALVLVGLFRRPAAKAAPPLHPRRDALAALAALRQRMQGLAPDAIAAEVSAILRRYWLARYGVPAPFRTRDELFEKDPPVALSVVPDPSGTGLFVPKAAIAPPTEPLRPFEPLAEVWDHLAFAPEPADAAEAEKLITAAEQGVKEDAA
ncbi:MAG: DUF4381 family protein [Verrucomicrobiales bacterium]|nr:DUF4381 family protein [Verrucomicrobiales bacterium]